jgi:hypothetical protein
MPMPQPTLEPQPEPMDDGPNCVAGKICFGPVLALGLPNPIGFGIHARIHEQFGAGLDYQFLPSIGVTDDANVGISLFTLNGRWYPGGSSFFLTLGLAFQSVYGEAAGAVMNASGEEERIAVEASATLPGLMFGLGVMGGEGFVMGIDLALAVPFGGEMEVDTKLGSGASSEAVEEYARLSNDVVDGGNDVIDIIPLLFQLNLIRIGYMF